MLTIDTEGWITHTKVSKKSFSAIQHGDISKINAIVLHRTGSASASSVFSAYNGQKTGAHFLIGETGTIYQTASIKQKCWHVGKIYSRCRTTNACTEEDATEIEALLHKKNTSWGKKFTLVKDLEMGKAYPERFPHNHDSLGIEIVGVLSNKTKLYETPNKVQNEALYWLLDELICHYSLSLTDIYAHGKIAHKDAKKSEGASALQAYKVHKSK